MFKKTLIKPFVIAALLLLTAAALSGCFNKNQASQNKMPGMDMSNGSMDHGKMGNTTNPGATVPVKTAAPFEVLTGNTFTITAMESQLQIDEKTTKNVWTYNGTVPGPQIRVKQGENIKVVLKNDLKVPVTIHWHGVPVPNNMDGIPGVTMNAVQPGGSFTYKFKADVPGTYWYHSHQDGVNQVDKGLYGSFIVESAKEEAVNRDYTLVLDEWMAQDNGSGHGGMDMGNNKNGGMNMGTNASGQPMSDAEMMPMMYTIFTANGKSGSAIPPLMVKEGEKVRIRLINAGFLSHKMHLQGHEYKILTTDGQPVNNPAVVNGQLLNIAPGERYDIEFTANHPGKWLLDEHGTNPGVKGMTIPILYENASGDAPKPDNTTLPLLDITKYGTASKGNFTLNDKYNVEYTMDLNTEIKNGKNIYTINGKAFPDTASVVVKDGDLVKVKMVNKSPKDVHPMHLHGHFFQVLSKNGQPISGSPLIKDTLNVLPGEEYEVAFKADNPGDWMFHCHDLGHASTGMVTTVKYEGFKSDFSNDPKAGNKPE